MERHDDVVSQTNDARLTLGKTFSVEVFGSGLLIFINFYGLMSVLQALFLKRVVARYEDELFAPTRLVRVNGAWYQITQPML